MKKLTVILMCVGVLLIGSILGCGLQVDHVVSGETDHTFHFDTTQPANQDTLPAE